MIILSCLDALAACNYLPQSREKIIAALFKALNSTNNELQEAGEACMRKVGATSLMLFLFHCKYFNLGDNTVITICRKCYTLHYLQSIPILFLL